VDTIPGFSLRLDGWRFNLLESFPDSGDEAIALLRDRLDELVLAGLFAESFAEDGDIAGETSLFDEGVGPDLAEQLFFADNTAAVLHQEGEHLERFVREGDRFAAFMKKAARGIEAEFAELIDLP
jgi:hypothetical protein